MAPLRVHSRIFVLASTGELRENKTDPELSDVHVITYDVHSDDLAVNFNDLRGEFGRVEERLIVDANWRRTLIQSAWELARTFSLKLLFINRDTKLVLPLAWGP